MKVTLFGPEGPSDMPAAELKSALAANVGLVWVDMTGPTDEDVQVMREVFNFHPLAIEDACKKKQRPKVDDYGDYLFIILNPAAMVRDRPAFRELDVFLGRNYIVTVHAGDEPAIDDARKRVGRTAQTSSVSAGYLLYLLVDVSVDSYFAILDALGERIEEMGNLVLEKPTREQLNTLFRLRKALLELRRVSGPQRDMFNALTRRDLPLIDQRVLQYFLRDVYDHLLRIMDMIDTFRDAVTSTVDLYMSAVSNRLSQVVNRLAVITVVIGTLGVISGFYGMNFEQTWPPFPAPWGVSFALGFMILITGLLLLVFRKAGWY